MTPVTFAPPPMSAPVVKQQSDDVKKKASRPMYASAFN